MNAPYFFEAPQTFEDVLDAYLYRFHSPGLAREAYRARMREWESQHTSYGWSDNDKEALVNLMIAFAVKDRP